MGIIETIKMITREEGVEIGIEKTRRDMIKNLILNSDFDNQKIATLCEIEESEVIKMRQDLGL